MAARGTFPECGARMGKNRLTPADAGNTFADMSKRPAGAGLSPLARGTRCLLNLSWLRCRFIPASAGNTELQVVELRCKAVYPR